MHLWDNYIPSKTHTTIVSLAVDQFRPVGEQWLVYIGLNRLHSTEGLWLWGPWKTISTNCDKKRNSGCRRSNTWSGQDVKWNMPRLSVPLCFSQTRHGALWLRDLSYSPGDPDLKRAAPPLTSLCCIRETPHAPYINNVIQNQHVKASFAATRQRPERERLNVQVIGCM